MGGDRTARMVCDTLKDAKNTIVVFVGGSSEIVNLTRLEASLSAPFREWAWAVERLIMKKF